MTFVSSPGPTGRNYANPYSADRGKAPVGASLTLAAALASVATGLTLMTLVVPIWVAAPLVLTVAGLAGWRLRRA